MRQMSRLSSQGALGPRPAAGSGVTVDRGQGWVIHCLAANTTDSAAR
jgi:hypothetical protein